MPARWQIIVPGVDVTRVAVTHLHAVTSGWFDTEATHRDHVKPYTVSPPAARPGGIAFEVALLDDALTGRLLGGAAPGVHIRLGSQHARLDAEPQRIAGATWAQLAEPTAATAWAVRFRTPTCFRRGNNFTPWPAPSAVLGGLRRAWQYYASGDLPPLVLDLAHDPMWVTDIDGANEVISTGGLTVSGFVGRIRYTSDASADVCQVIDRLMRLAPYSGIGARTTAGFGHVELETTWQRRP